MHVLGDAPLPLVHEDVPVIRMCGAISGVADAVFAYPSLSKITRIVFQDVGAS